MLLRSKDKERLIQIFSSVPLPIEVWAYGSRVDGSAHDGSDLDVVIRTHNGEKVPIHLFLELKDAIKQSNIPIVVDVFDWARLSGVMPGSTTTKASK